MTKVSSLLLLLTSIFSPAFLADDALSPTQHLDDDGVLISDGSRFQLGFFSPVGSSDRYIGIWYHKYVSVQTVVWVANRQRPVAGRSGRLSMMANGTVIITENSTVIWSTSSPALENPVARLLDNGNFVVTERGAAGSRSFVWESFNFPADTLLPGMKLGWDLTSGINRNLTAWSSPSDPSPGKYAIGIDLHGEPQIFLWSGTRQYWRAGPWNGIRFSGIPQMKVNLRETEVVINSHEVTMFYDARDPSMILRLVANYSGFAQDTMWIEGKKSWRVMGFAPRDECDSVSPCGPNGVCYSNRAPICTCMQGFHPKNSRSWDLGDSTDGCVRNTSLDCASGTDGFLKQVSMKLPDTSRSTVNRSMSLEQCRDLCLRNCSCRAYASANISGSGSGCIIWTTDLTDVRWFDSDMGQDLYVRLAASDLGTESEVSLHGRAVAIILVTAVINFLIGCGGASCFCRRKWRDRCKNQDEVKNMDLPLYDLATIVNATGNFSLDNKLGEGGFGPVYKGKLGNEKNIAVKRLSKTSRQGVDEFKNEVTLIAKLQHRNLVRLLGCCIEGEERMLVYEYMSNGSLDAFLFGDETKSLSLDWATRYNIILGISRGLLYLHQDSRLRIIHRDLKAANILLDEYMNPKISDFGMARIFGEEESEKKTRRVVGTYGYMSPEYAMQGIFSVKSDVFSFGILILEIITGKRNRGGFHSTFHLNLLELVWSYWNEGKALELVDRLIGHGFPNDEVLCCIKIGLLCVEEHPTNRPTMSLIVKMLGKDSGMLPEPKQPSFVTSIGSSIKLNLPTPSSINSISKTTVEGR